jgi:hypothetical protein
MMDANFSLKRMDRKEELEPYAVDEESRVWVQKDEVDAAAKEEKEFKEAASKKGKGRADDEVPTLSKIIHISLIQKKSIIL